jgi:DNA-binding transcriptional regulator LsrR (DeoR family)
MAEKEGLHQRLKQAIVWLKQNKNILQIDIAKNMGMTTVGLSRGLARCKEKNDEEFVIKFHQATGEIFSLDWLLYGTGEKFTADIKKAEQATASPGPTPVDASSGINAAIAAYAELTNRLKQEMSDRLADKDTIIAEKQSRIAELKDTIAAQEGIIKARDARILELERQLAVATTSDITRYPFKVGVAEEREQTKI